MDAAHRDQRWAFIEHARPGLIAALAPDGVVRIEVVAMFPHADHVGIWLCTATDKQRDSLTGRSPRLEAVTAVLLESGFTRDQLEELTTTAQSQETVDRDYEGSWFYALR